MILAREGHRESRPDKVVKQDHEAMKMETEVQAAIAGKILLIHVIKGDRVNPGEILIEIEA